MKLHLPSLALFAALAAALPLAAQEPIPNEEAVRVAHQLVNAIGNPSDAPFTTDVDADKPHGFKAGGLGLMAIPDRKLTTHALEHAAKETVPVGQLWTLAASLASGGKAIGKEQIRQVTVGEGEKAKTLQLYYLGAARSDAGELQLVFFAKDPKQAVLRLPLKQVSGKAETAPIELEGRKQDENTGLLTIRLLGEYTAEVPVMKPQE